MLSSLEKGRLEKTACLHQHLLSTGKNTMEAFKVLKVAFGE
jgi:hypothetical protein